MKITLVFDPDPDLGSDPNDPHQRPYQLGEFFDSDKCDVMLLVRQWDEKFQDGSETQVFSSGTWENVEPSQIEEILDQLGTVR